MKSQPGSGCRSIMQSMKSQARSLCHGVLALLFVSSVTHASDPIRYADLEKAGFTKLRWQNLKDEERSAFYEAYAREEEMLSRVRLGPINPQPLQECISGEAPAIAEAKKKFPLHYPMMGRMKNVSGVLEWHEKQLIFRTARQRYHVDEYHILYRLEQLGFVKKTGPRKATTDIVWMVNKINGLRVLYMQHIKLQ